MARFHFSGSPEFDGVRCRVDGGDIDGARTKAEGWIYAGYKMTIFSTAEEQQREPLEIGGKVLFYPTSPYRRRVVR